MTTQRKLKNFALNMYLYRTKRHLSKAQLARITGLSVATLSYIENGERLPSLKTSLDICKKLGVELRIMLEDPIKEEDNEML